MTAANATLTSNEAVVLLDVSGQAVEMTSAHVTGQLTPAGVSFLGCLHSNVHVISVALDGLSKDLSP